jgi:pyridoxine/pyridoxamine 5'-phosphate oxidase
MPSRNESARALARLEVEAPISDDDANLLNLQKQVEDFVREAKRRDPSEPNELVSTVVDTAARDYFRHVILKQRRRASLSKRGDINS